jgi:flavin reductase (DIM6/NTAB) family NADH-FMN oxidoreductase RutF
MVAAASAGLASMSPASPPLALFRRLTNGVYVIGVSHNGRSNAFTAAWVTQVSFDPLLISLSINPKNFSHKLLRQSRVFAVSILKKGQLDLARHFGCQSGAHSDKLAGQHWRPGTLGAPVLLDCAAYLECRVVGTTAAGDHELVLGQVTHGELLDPDAAVLVYADTGDMDGSSALYPRNL